MKFTRKVIFSVISSSFPNVNMPSSISTPNVFRSPIPGPASCLSKPALNSSAIVLFSLSCLSIQSQILFSNRSFSNALIPSEPNVMNFECFSIVSTSLFSSRDLPAPAT